jgi:hypothetical protein
MQSYRSLRVDDTQIGFVFGGMEQIGPSFSVRVNISQKHRYAVCQCSCGNVVLLRINYLRTCPAGCNKCGRVTHGLSTIPEYGVWRAMIGRCCNPSHHAYADYGGRGIKICPRWRESFEAFYADMGQRPSRHLNLDRYPNNDGDYEPGNCRWATRKQNCRNKRTNASIKHRGQSMTFAELGELYGLPTMVLRQRIVKLGWSIERAIGTPRRKYLQSHPE